MNSVNQDFEQIERRAELAAKVSVLEERSLATKRQMEQLADTIIKHANEEEKVLSDLVDEVRNAKKDVGDTVDERVSKQLFPIEQQIRDVKTAWKVVSAVGSIVIAVIWFLVNIITDNIKKDYESTKEKVTEVDKKTANIESDIARLNSIVRSINERTDKP